MKINEQNIKQIKEKSEEIARLKKLISDNEEEIDDEIALGPAANQKEIEDLETEIEKYEKRIKALEKEMSDLAFESPIESIEEVNEALEKHKAELEDEARSFNGAYAITEEMQETIDELSNVREAIEYNNETLQMQSEIESLEAELESLYEDEKEFEGAYFIPEEITSAITEKQNKLEELRGRFSQRTINFGGIS